MSEYPKAIKRLLRQYAAVAYENELHCELKRLDDSFTQWRNGIISSGELSHRIHLYETQTSSKMFNRYNNGDDAINVAYAVVTGLIGENEVAAEVLGAIQKQLNFYRMLKERGELQMPGNA
jgi:hypothetical protein